MHHAQLIEQITPYSNEAVGVLDKLQQSGMSLQQATAQINRVITQQAAMLSADDIFYVSALICLGLIALVWLARPVKSGSTAAAASGAH